MGLILISTLALSGVIYVLRREDFQAKAPWGLLPPSKRAYLVKHFAFYNALPAKSKQIFEYRVGKFIKLKEFIPRQMDEVTEEMQVLISAAAVQITFGLPRVFLSYFENIIVFPDEFFSNANQRYHKGEVNPRMKAIVISWKHFVEGYSQNEGVNLGLHEMAHALQLENIVQNNEYDFLDEDDIKEWQHLANTEIEKIRNGETPFFRKYGGTNHAEFFAVAVENFFERPHEYKAYNPALYSVMRRLLNQDPRLILK